MGRKEGSYGISGTVNLRFLAPNSILEVVVFNENELEQAYSSPDGVEPMEHLRLIGVPRSPHFVWDIFQNDFVQFLKNEKYRLLEDKWAKQGKKSRATPKTKTVGMIDAFNRTDPSYDD